MNSTLSTLPGFLSDDSFILQDTTDSIKEEEGSVVGLSTDPVTHASNLPNQHLIERIDDAYSPELKDKHYLLKGYNNAPLSQIRKLVTDKRGNDKAIVQYKGKLSDNAGRSNRPTTHFSKKSQSVFRNKLCSIDPNKVLSRPYFITLTSTPYIYELRRSDNPSAVSDFIKKGLSRWKERLRRHDQYKHLTGLYKWEHTQSELPHLHWLAWFCKWNGNENTPENELLDYNWIAQSWFECLFHTPQLRKQNEKHLHAGTQTQPLRGSKKKAVTQEFAPTTIEQPLSKEELTAELNEIKQLSLEQLNKDMQVGGNYISKYIGKSEESIPEGFTGRHWGTINRFGFNSCVCNLNIDLNEENGQKVFTKLGQLDNERKENLVRYSKKKLHLIKREEILIPLLPDESPNKYLNEKIDLIDFDEGTVQVANIERKFLHKWERVVTDDGDHLKPSHNIVVLEHLDADGNSVPYIMEFKEHVYDADGNYIGVYEQITLAKRASDDNSLSGYDGKSLSDLVKRINFVNANGVNEEDNFIQSKFVLHKHGKIISIYDEWHQLGGVRLNNSDEYKYKSFKSFRGVNSIDLLKLTFPDHVFIGDYRFHKTEIGKNKYIKEDIELCIDIVPKREMIVCLE